MRLVALIVATTILVGGLVRAQDQPIEPADENAAASGQADDQSADQRKLPPPELEKLRNMEKVLPEDSPERLYRLGEIAKAAFDAGRYDDAEAYANELLDRAPHYRENWYYGGAVFVGNMVLGRVALKRDGNLSLAESFLKASALTPGSPQLKVAGPNMSLARDILVAGDREPVLAFLGDCHRFWTINAQPLDEWSKTIADGGMPNFGPHLLY